METMTENKSENKKRVFSAIKPTGNPTLGNYLGAMQYWGGMSDEYDCIFSVADLHAITVAIEPKDLRENSKRLFALLIAVGIDPEKNVVFMQSHVRAHSELCWLLNNYTMFGEARRMTQFKEKSEKAPENINVGLFDYPVLMAADILLYQTDIVPVGEDQLQHVELCRNIAERFNNRYSPTFKMPEGKVPKAGARIYSLTDPTAKMGKSDSGDAGAVFILDTPETIMRKFKRAVTDSDTEVRFDVENKPGVSNLLSIYSCFTGKTIEQAQNEFSGKGYGDFKIKVAESVIEGIAPIQSEQQRIAKDKAYMDEVLKDGAMRACRIAYKTLDKVYKKVGFIPKIR